VHWIALLPGKQKTYLHRNHVCIANISVMMTNSRSRSVPWTLLLATFALAIVIADPVLAKMGGTDESEDSTSPHLTEAGLLELALDTDADAGVDVDDNDDVDDEDDEQLGAENLLDDPPAPPASTVDKVLCFATVFKDVASGINSLACPAKQEECPKRDPAACAKAKVDFMIVGQKIFRLVVTDPSNWEAYYQLATEVCAKGRQMNTQCVPSCNEKTNSALESIEKMCAIGASLEKCIAMPVSLQLNAATPPGKGTNAANTATGKATAANTATGKTTAANTATGTTATGNMCKAPNGGTYPLSFDNVCNQGCPQPGYCSEYCKCPSALQMVSDALQAFINIKGLLKDWKGKLEPPQPSTASPQCQSAKAAEDLFGCTLDTISFINNIVSGKFKIPSSLKGFIDLMNADSFCNFLNSNCGANAVSAFPPLNPIKTACGLGSLLANLIICTPVGNMMGQSLPTACQLTIEYGKPVGYEKCRFPVGTVDGCNSDGKGKLPSDVFEECKNRVAQAAKSEPGCQDSIFNILHWGVDVAPSCKPWPDADCPTNQCRYSCMSDCVRSAIANRDSKCPLPVQQVFAYSQGSKDQQCGQVLRQTKAEECPKKAKFTGQCIPPPVWQYLGACQGSFGTKVDWSGAKCCAAEQQWCMASGYNILTPLSPPVSSEASTAIKASLTMEGCNTWCARAQPYGGGGKCGPFKSTAITCCNETAGLTCYPYEKKCT
jgi:hypothetical protein